jgi:hypothetical protein
MKTKHRSWLALLVTVLSIAGIAGCNQQPARDGGAGAIPYNEDSVRGHILKIDDALKYTAKYRSFMDSTGKQLDRRTAGGLDFGKAEAFNRDAIAVLLNQKDSLGNPAAGIRIYYGVNEGGQVRMILVPYDSKGNEIIHQLIAEKAAKIPGVSDAKAYWDSGQAIENGQRCPAVCGTSGLSGPH